MRILLCVFVVLALAAPDARAADAAATAAARAHYDKAIAHYDLAEYDAAIAEFKQAYELAREPGLLFNIAQAYRLSKRYEQALHFYRTYLDRKPDAPNRDDAEAQIAKMEDALKSAQTPAPVVAPQPVVVWPPEAAPGVGAAPRPSFAHTTRGKITIALAAVGAAALVSAAGTGGEALAVRHRYDAGCAGGPCDGSLYARGRGYAIATDVLLSVGVVAAVAATVVGLVHRRERPLTLGMRF